MDGDALTNHPAIRRANSVSSAKIQSYIPHKQTVKGNVYCFRICKAAELSESLEARIWEIFERNMKSIYEMSSVFPWNPPEKRQQLFHKYSRLILVTPDSRTENNMAPNDEDVIAYSIFRFEREEGRNVIYLYELQASDTARRLGLGRALVCNLVSIAKGFKMSAIMLTHLKANEAASHFYDSLGFETDETSPDYEDHYDQEDSEENGELDEGYSILSLRIDAC